MNKTQHNISKTTSMIVQTALLVAVAVVVHLFAFIIPIAGMPMMRISFAGPFIKIPGLLFGPVAGGISGGLVDILGFLLKPMGGYIPGLTISAILAGALPALIWPKVKNMDVKKFHRMYIGVLIGIGLTGIINHVVVLYVSESLWAQYILSIGKKAAFATIGFELAAIVGFVFLLISKVMHFTPNKMHIYPRFLKLIIVIGIPALAITTLNTLILRAYIAPDKPFILFWIPRVAEELLMIPLQAYIIALLLHIYDIILKKEV